MTGGWNDGPLKSGSGAGGMTVFVEPVATLALRIRIYQNLMGL